MLRCINILDCMRMMAYKNSTIAISSIKQKYENQAQYEEQLQQQRNRLIFKSLLFKQTKTILRQQYGYHECNPGAQIWRT